MPSAEGRNYRIERRDDGCVIATVRRRPDLDTTAGADDCETMCAAILATADRDIVGLVLDLTEAPPIAGPRTQATLTTMLRAWVRGRRRAVLVIGPSAVQRLQLDRMVAHVASPAVTVMTSTDDARAWLLAG